MLQNGPLLEKAPRRGGEKQARGKRVRSAALQQPASVSKHRHPHEDRAVCGARFTWIPASCNRSYSTHRGSIPVDSGLSLEYPQEPMEKSYDYSIKHLEKWKRKKKKNITIHRQTLEIADSDQDHRSYASVTISQVTWLFWFPIAYKWYVYTYYSLLSVQWPFVLINTVPILI